MTKLNDISMIKDKQLAEYVISLLLDRAIQVDYVLELVTTSFITIDEQLANKLHIAMARTTTNLLKEKQAVINLGNVTIPFAYNNDKLSKLDCESKITFMLDICRVVFPTGKLEGASEHSKRIFNDTINCLKQLIKKKDLTKKTDLTSIYYSNPDRVNYLNLLIKNNNIFED